MNENAYALLSREEILRKRKERTKIKKELKDAQLFEENGKKSDKIKILKSDDFTKIKTVQKIAKPEKIIKCKKLENFNLFDFVDAPSFKQSINPRKTKFLKTKVTNVCKRYKFKRKIISRMKKVIKKSRLKRKVQREQTLKMSDKIIEGLENLEQNDENACIPCLQNTNYKKEPNIVNSNTITIPGESQTCVRCFNGYISNNEAVIEKLDNKFKNLKINKNQEILVKTIHSRRFRSYCNNLTSPKLHILSENLIRKIYEFQKRAYAKNQIKARAHRRYVVGFHETRRYLTAGKVKLVIIAPDCEKCGDPGGIEETINWIKEKCDENQIYYLFSLRARQLSYCLFIKVPVHCLAIINYDGAEDIYNELIENLLVERENYKQAIATQYDNNFVKNENII